MTSISREFQVFVKPVGAECNLRCTYCYYLKKGSLYPGIKQSRMSDDLLEKYIMQHIHATTEKMVFFSWHGGEPLLAGIDFFKKAVHYQKKHLPGSKTILNGIQTNGILLNDDWCRFFSDEEFIVGLSIDGPGDLHNKNRRTEKKQPTLEKVINGHQLLQKNSINPEILCVVNGHNVKYPMVVYDFFRDIGTQYITFLPLVERLHDSSVAVTPDTVPPFGFGIFMSDIFDEWIEKDIGRIKIQIVEEAARTAFNQEHTLCIFKDKCGGVPVVEHNGDFYSCDHYVDEGHRLGNLNERSLSYFLDSPVQKSFGELKLLTLPDYCIGCEVREMCNGECPKNRFITTPDGEPGLNYLCKGYKHFFNHIRPFVKAIGTLTSKSPRGDFAPDPADAGSPPEGG